MSKVLTHTPGPWVVRVATMLSTEHIWVYAPETIIGRTIAGPVPQDILCDEDYPTKLADATLIAAAPNMLDALRNVQKLISEAAMTGFNCHNGDWADRLFFSQQKTSTAIDTATILTKRKP